MNNPVVQAVANSEQCQVFKSRWGYHSVNREDFLILKALHKQYWQALYQAYRWKQWVGKKPQNRWSKEPVVDPNFVDVTRKSYIFLKEGNTILKTTHLPFTMLHSSIISDFKNARMPCSCPELVKPIDMEKYKALASVMV